jgi:hypothetical protein
MQIELFNDDTNSNNTYSKKVTPPQYLPSAVAPDIADLCMTTKYGELKRNILASNVSDEEKDFLLKAATRHIVFNYAKIADYYAHATPEMQRLMEQSALVIIDFNDAIANGYVNFSTLIKDISNASGVMASEK